MRHFLLCLTLFASMMAGTPSVAETKDPGSEHKMGEGVDHSALHVAHGWARASLGQNPNSVAYVTIHNPLEENDRVVSLSCTAAERCEIHNHTMDGGVMKMRRVESLAVDGGAHIEFAPGGLHIMMMGLVSPLKAGDKVELVFNFEKTGERKVEAEVLSIRDAAERGKKSAHDMHKPGHNH